MLDRRQRRRRRPQRIELGDSALIIVWGDGRRTEYSLEHLRRECPCASCRQVRSQPQELPSLAGNELPMLSGEAAAATAAAVGFDPVGRYGLRLRWADGHDAGIYTFEMLRQLA